ncbi:MAG: aminoglycoside phosphotransferase family protein [Deltaproteobacteria bacterium]|nr:aminoglycoside phosphotransferase family protein [Deltaproteobacteria bacterium]
MRETLLPDQVAIQTRADLAPLEPAFAAALAVIRARHGLASQTVSRADTGSSPVFLLDDCAVKIVPPQWKVELDREVLALEAAHDKLTVRTPAVRATGTIDAWTYMVSDRCAGVSLKVAGPSMDERSRRRVSAQVGEALASLHNVSTSGLDALACDWAEFARARIASVQGFQRRTGLHESAVERIRAVLEEAAPLIVDERRALIHGDLHHEHALVERDGDRWNLVGVLDFGDAMIGHPEYDLVTPAFFVARTDRGALEAMFDAIGFVCDERSSRRLVAWSALHQYNALARFLPADHGADALDVIRTRYWPTA